MATQSEGEGEEREGKSTEIITAREKLAAATIISIALALSILTLVLTAIYAVPRMSTPPPRGYYPNILKQDGWSTCWEASIFATTSDPFYQWVSGSGLPDALNVSQKGTLAYQRMSIWRVSGSNKKDNSSCSVYNSPDPHLLGGQFFKRSRTAVWKMTVNWGLSVRSCFTLPGRSQDDTCLFTSPIVQTENGSYAALMIGVPYRKALPDPYGSGSSDLYLDREAVYHSNFVSNARTSPGLFLNYSQNGTTRNYVYRGPACDDSRHILLTPDVVAYLGFPSLQCACSGKVCLIGQDFTGGSENDDDIYPLRLNSTGCRYGKSFWDFDAYPLKENRTLFFSYNARWRTSVSLNVSFSDSFNSVILSNPSQSLPLFERFVSCVEDNIEREGLANGSLIIQQLKKFCLAPPIVALTPVFDSVLERYKARINLDSLMQTFERKVPSDDDDSVLCGLDQGQANLEDKLCALSLDRLKSGPEMDKLKRRLQASLKVADIRKFVKEEWARSSSQRSDIIIGLVTAVVTVVVTIWGMFNRDLQEMEAIIINRTRRFKLLVKKTVGIPVFRTLMRAMVLFGVILWNMFNVFRSFKSVSDEPRVATSGTLLQQLNGISFLVTTTSTVQVTPYWIIFYITMSVAMFVLVSVTFCVYVRMRYLENKGEDGAVASTTGMEEKPEEKPLTK